jgi:hypothetical protein
MVALAPRASTAPPNGYVLEVVRYSAPGVTIGYITVDIEHYRGYAGLVVCILYYPVLFVYLANQA